jgi:hypothetical protein
VFHQCIHTQRTVCGGVCQAPAGPHPERGLDREGIDGPVFRASGHEVIVAATLRPDVYAAQPVRQHGLPQCRGIGPYLSPGCLPPGELDV